MDLENSIKEYNQKNYPNLRFDVAAYIIGLINSLPTKYRGDENQLEYAYLCSGRLRSISYNYSKYIDLLLKKKFIDKVGNYGSDEKKCNAYCLSRQYRRQKIRSYAIEDPKLTKRLVGKSNPQIDAGIKEFVEKRRPHLISNFDDYLSMDIRPAHEEISPLRRSNTPKYISCSQLLLEWHRREWSYSINPNTDNRLHTLLTRTPRILRKYIQYNGNPLGAIDLKTSQPYFFCALMTGIIRKDLQSLQRIGAARVLGGEIIKELFDLDVGIDNARDFVSMVLHEDLYASLSTVVQFDSDDIGPYRMIWSKTNWTKGKVRKHYESERDLVKEVVLEAFNGKSSSKQNEVLSFRRAYPAVFEIIDKIKLAGVEFYRVLSHIEAHCLLDVLARDIKERWPERPLFSIHDALVTAREYLPYLAKEMETDLIGITGLRPRLKIEEWGEEYSA